MAVLVTAALVGCGGGDGLPEAQPVVWFVVDEAVNRSVEGATIYHQGPAAPVLLNPPRVSEGAARVIVSAVISPDGRIARAAILRRIEGSPGQADVLATLRPLRFRPATLEGKPVAVYYNLTLPVP